MNHFVSEPQQPSSRFGDRVAPGADRAGDTNIKPNSYDVIWFSVRAAGVSVTIRGTLPASWTLLFVDFRKRMRHIPVPTRRELVRHMWRQFAELPMVDVTKDQQNARRNSLFGAPRSNSVAPAAVLETAPDAPQFEVCEYVTPDDMLRVLHTVARAVRRRTRWPW